MLFSDNELSAPERPANAQMRESNESATNEAAATQSEGPMTQTPNISEDNEDNGVVTETLRMTVEEISVVIHKSVARLRPTKVATLVRTTRILPM